METLRALFFSLMLVNLIKRNILHFFNCYIGLGVGRSMKEAIDSFFRRAL